MISFLLGHRSQHTPEEYVCELISKMLVSIQHLQNCFYLHCVWELRSIACKTSELWRNSDKIEWNLFYFIPKKKSIFNKKETENTKRLARQKTLLTAGPVFPLGSQRLQLWFEAGLSTSSFKTMPQFPITQTRTMKLGSTKRLLLAESTHSEKGQAGYKLLQSTLQLPCSEPLAATAL